MDEYFESKREFTTKEKIKNHIKKHKVIYVCGTTAVVTAGITYLVVRDRSIGDTIGVPAQNTIGVLGKRIKLKDSTLNTVSYISADRQGPASWVVRCLETGEVFTSQKAAASEMGLAADHISRHLNGLRDHVNGYHFERICMAA